MLGCDKAKPQFKYTNSPIIMRYSVCKLWRLSFLVDAKNRKGAQMMPRDSQNRRSACASHSRPLDLQRWSLLIGGGALALYAATRRSKSAVALATAGGLLAYGGSKLQQQLQKFRAQSSFVIDCSPEEAYRFWRNLQNLPLFMRHLESVRVIDERRSEWTAIGPLDTRLRWKAEIVEERENEFIAWRSIPGSEFHNRGSVEFRRAPGNRGTIVTATMEYEPPAGALGKVAAAILGKDPESTMREDLRRFKALIEAGEIPTIEGQTHGPRSALVAAIQNVHPERRKPSEFRVSERMTAERRAS
jgi:uncharacterized membrane protein